MGGEGRYGPGRRLDGKSAPQEPGEVPVGHSVVAHRVFGWCAACRGKLSSDEIVEWRAWAAWLIEEGRVDLG